MDWRLTWLLAVGSASLPVVASHQRCPHWHETHFLVFRPLCSPFLLKSREASQFPLGSLGALTMIDAGCHDRSRPTSIPQCFQVAQVSTRIGCLEGEMPGKPLVVSGIPAGELDMWLKKPSWTSSPVELSDDCRHHLTSTIWQNSKPP